MNKQSLSQISLLMSALLLCCCVDSQKQGAQNASSPELDRKEQKPKASIPELRQLYETAQSEFKRAALKSEYEQRAVCLRAIDEGAIRPGVHISLIDEIFGTNFTSRTPTEKGDIEKAAINFAPQYYQSPRQEGKVEAIDYIGWYLAIDYDHDGNLQSYFLSNVHKGSGLVISVDKRTALIAELKGLYQAAPSELERRALCLRAIDEGAIQPFGPVSSVDEILGTRFASDLPARGEEARKASVDLAPPVSGSDNSGATPKAGWVLAVEYGDNGKLYHYSLTNIHR